jgi:homoserine kinase
VKQQGAMASFISGLYEKKFEKIGFGLQDFLVEPFRKKLIPHFDLLKESALANGALGCSISGSGPSVFALSNDENTAKKIELGFRKIFEKETISFETYLSKVNVEGPRIIDLV